VQTTLLGLAIAAILALVTALVGPAFVDWTKYRANFEAEAARAIGQPVRIGGGIDVRLLPTPTIVLRDVEIGTRAAPVFGAQAMRVELALEGLMRGEMRAASLALTGPEIAVALDANGRLVARLRTLGFDPDNIAIDRLAVTDGRLALEDATSGTRMLLDKLAFSGEVRAQSGQVKGDGVFNVAGQTYRYSMATGRRDAGIRVRLGIEPAGQPLMFESEGTLTFENESPKFEGTASLARPAGVVLDSGKTVASEPWRIAGRVRANTGNATFEDVEATYGPDERRIRLGGTADFKFGAQPRFDSVLSARQVDLDRALAAGSASGSAAKLPLMALSSLVDFLRTAGRPPFPVSLGIGIDAVTLGGATLQSVRADIQSLDGAWSVDTFEMRAPGATQVKLSGRIGGGQGAAEFSGPVAIDSGDPSVLTAWLEGADRPRGALGPMKLRSDIAIGPDRLAFERVVAEIDRKALEGRLVYTFPQGAQRARLDVALNAAEFDFESAYAFVTTALAGSSVERPGDIALALDLGRATFAGITATSTKANLRFDAGGLRIEKLAIADFGGAALTGSGQIDIASAQPRGAIALNLAAPKLDGVAAVLEKFLPGSGDMLTRNAARLSPAKVDATLTVEPSAVASGDKSATAKLAMNGQLGNMRLVLSGEGAGNVGAPDKADIKFDARVTSDDGALLSTLGLDGLTSADKRPANLSVTANGPLGGELRIDAKLVGEGFDLASAGTLKFSNAARTGTLTASFSSADVRGLRRQGAAAFPVSLKSSVTVAGNVLNFSALDGKAGGSAVKGRLSLALAQNTQTLKEPWRIDGKLAADTLDVSSLLASIVGAPAPVAATQTPSWPSQSFAPTMLSNMRGRIEFDAAQATVVSSVVAQKLHGVVSFGASEVSFESLTAVVGGGNASVQANFQNVPGGLSLRGSAALTSADATAVIRSGAQTPVAGRIAGQLTFESTGSSPAALVAGLRGAGSISLDKGQIAALDRKAIETAAQAVERGTPIAPPRITEIVARALENGPLTVASASAPIELTNGRARLGKLITPNATDVAFSGALDLVEETLDARFTLFGSAAADTQGLRPELTVLYKGPIAAPRRTVDVTTLTSWLTLQSVERESHKLEAEEREAKRRERLEALIRESAREPAITAPVPAPTVTGTTPSPGIASTAPGTTNTGLFAPVLPAPQFIPNVSGRSSATPPAADTKESAPALSAIAPAAPLPPPIDVAPTPGALPLNPPLPARRPSANATPGLAPPLPLTPRSRSDNRLLLAPQ
jgi:uncharacterized protein involved in outer membrane biogenesis